MKRHPNAIAREQRQMHQARAKLRHRLTPFVPADARPLVAAVEHADPKPWDDDLPVLTGRRHAHWYHVMRGVQRSDDRSNWSWEAIAESIGQTDAIVVASTQKYWCIVTHNGRRIYDNHKDIKIVGPEAVDRTATPRTRSDGDGR